MVKCGLLKNPPIHPGNMVLGWPEYPNRSYEPHRQLAARELFSPQNSFSRSNHLLLCPAGLELSCGGTMRTLLPTLNQGPQKNWVLELFLKEITVRCHSQGTNSPKPFMVGVNLFVLLLRKSWTVKCGLLRTRLRIQEIWSSDNLSTRIGLTSCIIN